MILHIVKKDLHLLWPFVAGLTALNALVQWMRYGFSVLDDNSGWVVLGTFATIGWILLVVLLVHQDVIPGTRQDWLTRPIKRRDLVAAKLLFVVGLLHAPLFVMMTIEVLAAGYSLPEAMGAAFARSLTIFIAVSLTTGAVAAVTRNFVEAVITAIVVAVVAEAATQVLDGITNEPCGATCGSTLVWVGMAARVAVVALAAFAVIALQYFKRGTTSWARAVLLVAAFGFVLAGRWSWNSAFAIQRAVTGAAAEPARVAISFASGQPAPPARQGAKRAAILAARSRLRGMESDQSLVALAVSRQLQGTTISLPLRIAGQRAGTVLWADRVEIRLLDADGRMVYRGEGDELEIRAATGVAQTFFIPSRVFSAHAATELRAELDYWLTSLVENAAATLPASGGETRLPSGEQCSARPLRAGDAIRLSCLTIHRPPSCYAAALEGGADLLVCAPSYVPDAIWGNLFWRFGIDVPIEASTRIDDAALRLVSYEPRNHFTAQIVIPELRLADWVADSPL
jgi:hypothetical protein